ncbi:MAG: hypothetical protein DME65_02750, partial [Verrucomicrobia bacterium]
SFAQFVGNQFPVRISFRIVPLSYSKEQRQMVSGHRNHGNDIHRCSDSQICFCQPLRLYDRLEPNQTKRGPEAGPVLTVCE